MDDKDDSGPLAPYRRSEKLIKALAVARRGVEERSEQCLRQAHAIDQGFATKHWRQKEYPGAMELDTLALPAAARMGWAQGAAILIGMGADPNKPDADRQGFGLGRPPISEALGQGHFAAGARLEPLSQLVWSATFQAHRRGVGAGTAVLDWLESKGLLLWGDDGLSKSAQSAFLFTGSLREMSAQDIEQWEKRVFGGMGDGEGARACLWNHMFSVSNGVDKSAWLCERYLSQRDAGLDASGLLERALEGGCPVAAKTAAKNMAKHAGHWSSWGGDAFLQAAKAHGVEGKIDPERKVQAVGSAWEELGDKLVLEPVKLVDICVQAMISGDLGLFEGLMNAARLDPKEVMSHWSKNMPSAQDRRYSQKRAIWGSCAVVAMAKQLESEGGRSEKTARSLVRLFDSSIDEQRAEAMFAQAQRKALGVATAWPAEVNMKPSAPRL
jgi:hypothetical protein